MEKTDITYRVLTIKDAYIYKDQYVSINVVWSVGDPTITVKRKIGNYYNSTTSHEGSLELNTPPITQMVMLLGEMNRNSNKVIDNYLSGLENGHSLVNGGNKGTT